MSVADIDLAMRARTRLVAVSWVQFASGARIDLAELGRLCGRRGVMLLVDAIQGAGVVPLNVGEVHVDFVAGASHKWLRAPLGVGWLYVRPDRLDEVDLVEVGQSTVTQRPAMTDYAFDLRPDARRFESGVFPMASIAGLDGALEDLERDGGVSATWSRVSALTSRLVGGLAAGGHHVVTPIEDARRAGIVSFVPRDGTADGFATRARDAGFVVAVREGWVRVSLHRSNTENEVERFLESA